ncbi:MULTISPECIES: NAD(P)-dependent oxidoreductase [unclassified Pseudofrankia]|uniref:NAD-dependent epimerase/dehydratase family protein n=1 Tax=unclassified Pseudofrankia TaxID=2994372 RepID=UPI0008DA50EF|nr:MULTISPECIES: NAD(P)-dependent oxidoreductase [unclassified Pseudofrankia]MDT3440638.1 NAD(P)-dependent oxidoreductase [Pseudofrankia sp. BMG5.37]OHV60569.1 epimerase [Pseudofrankia sp. BMG5.36]
MRVLVTGDRGLVGTVVTAALTAAGHRTVGFDLADGHDVRDAADLERMAAGCDGIVHLAAVDEPVDDPDLAEFGPATTGTDAVVFETNALGTGNVLRAAERRGVPRVVVLSSVDVLGCFGGRGRPDYLPLDDRHPTRPAGAYGMSKWLAERMCAAATAATGVCTVCLRPPGVFTEEIYAGIRRARRDHPDFEWSPYWEYGAFLDVRDLASAVERALTAPLAGHHRLLLCAADISSSNDHARTLAERLLPDVEWRGGPEYETDPFRALVDASGARALLGWAPRHRWRPPHRV